MTLADSTKASVPPSPPAAVVQQDGDTLRFLGRRTRTLVLVLLPFMLLTSYLVWAGTSRRPTPPIADMFPRGINTAGHLWHSMGDAKMEDYELAILEYPQYLMRNYTDLGPNAGDAQVGLCVVYSQDNRKGTHPPEVCLEGGGKQIRYKNDRTVQVDDAGTMVTVRELVTDEDLGGGRSGQVYYSYFYKCGQRYTPSFYVQQFWIIFNGLKHRDASGALVRYNTDMRNQDDLDNARRRSDALIRATFPYVRKLGE